ncbi:NAD-dependent epimerase/dehydratase family protein [Christiangramia aquimixticola]|uniref:NAD-dependent epimerase/dehydratase family protein n=1 Tax=Christiangramia aquimixticola TaxID=1697558 RepID=UPI003AA8C972
MILVTGGTGLVGAHLLYELAVKKIAVRATKRNSSDLQKVKNIFSYYSSSSEAESLFTSIEWVTADINNIPDLTKAFEGITYVYHCAALISFDPSDEKLLRKINIEGTANVVNLCIANQVSKLCYVSSIATLDSNTVNEMVDENAGWNPERNHTDYSISKYGAEIEVWRATQEGIDAVIVNPGVIMGPGIWETGGGKIIDKIYKGLSFHFPKVTGFVGVYDVVNIMQELMNSSIKNEQFIVVAENLSFHRVFELTATALNKPKPHRALKKWMVFAGWIFQKIGSYFGLKREITRDAIEGVFKLTRYNNQKIKQALDLEFESLEEVINKTANYYRRDK